MYNLGSAVDSQGRGVSGFYPDSATIISKALQWNSWLPMTTGVMYSINGIKMGLIDRFWDLNFWFFAHTVGIFLYSVVYFLSFLIRPLKPILTDYRERGTIKSTFLITLISITIYSSIIYRFAFYPDFEIWKVVFIYIAWLLLGYFSLFLLYDYKSRNKRPTT